MALSQDQFEAANDKVDALLRGSKRGTSERAEAEAVSAAWEAVIALPQATAQQRRDRHAAIADVATGLGLALAVV
jgi:hypothetical protein